MKNWTHLTFKNLQLHWSQCNISNQRWNEFFNCSVVERSRLKSHFLSRFCNISVSCRHRGRASASEHISSHFAAAAGGLQGRKRPLDGAVSQRQGRTSNDETGVSHVGSVTSSLLSSLWVLKHTWPLNLVTTSSHLSPLLTRAFLFSSFFIVHNVFHCLSVRQPPNSPETLWESL